MGMHHWSENHTIQQLSHFINKNTLSTFPDFAWCISANSKCLTAFIVCMGSRRKMKRKDQTANREVVPKVILFCPYYESPLFLLITFTKTPGWLTVQSCLLFSHCFPLKLEIALTGVEKLRGTVNKVACKCFNLWWCRAKVVTYMSHKVNLKKLVTEFNSSNHWAPQKIS